MTHVRTIMVAALYVSMVGSRNDVEAQAPRPLDPQAAQQYASDSEKADSGDPEAAYRMGEAFESGRLAGVTDLNKALTFYRLAAGKGHQQAAERVAQIEADLARMKQEPPTTLRH
jgi:TPR repeat protein